MTENFLLRRIYKALALLLLTYALMAGLLIELPDIGGNIQQTSRNLFYHVPMWFTLMLLMALSLWWSIQYMRHGRLADDVKAREAVQLGLVFGVLGLCTGSVWSRVTWGALLPATDFAAWWAWDPKQTSALIAMLVYLAYLVLRGAVDERTQRARLAAVYNVFAGALLVPLLIIIPRMLGGLHPGGGEGSPVFNSADISNAYRIVFYPAIVGFMLLALWLLELRVRYIRLKDTIAHTTQS